MDCAAAAGLKVKKHRYESPNDSLKQLTSLMYQKSKTSNTARIQTIYERLEQKSL